MVATVQGKVLLGLAFVFGALICTAFVMESMMYPNGEVGVFYQVDFCQNANYSFNNTVGQKFDAYTLRSRAQNDPEACEIVPTVASQVDIELEPNDGDGYRMDSNYAPVIMLPRGSYATLAFEVVDADGAAQIPLTTIAIGPDQDYPWTIDSSTDALPEEGSGVVSGRRRTGALTDDDDDEEGEEIEEETPLDVVHTTAAPTRRLLFAAVAEDDDSMSDSDGAALPPIWTPGSRRLLKGGSTGGGASAGGRASTTGNSRWGVSSNNVRTTTYTTSTTPRKSLATGARYGGYSSYRAGNGVYYAGHRPYYYRYGGSVIYYRAPMYVVYYRGYGCYSCRYSRTQIETQSPAVLDRYELSFTMSTSGNFPYQLRIRNMTQFQQRGLTTGGLASRNQMAYFTFFTEAGDIFFEIKDKAMPIGWVGLILVVILLCCWYKTLFPPGERARAAPAPMPPTSVIATRGPTSVHVSCQPKSPFQTGQVVGGAYLGGNQMGGVAMTPVANAYNPQICQLPVAYPSQPYPSQPYATQQPYPQQQMHMPVAYPTAYAYPSNPPSPPGSSADTQDDDATPLLTAPLVRGKAE